LTQWAQHVNSIGDAQATMVDLAYALDAPAGSRVCPDYRVPLAAAIEAHLPWLVETPGAGIHRLNLVQGGAGQSLLARRTRLVLRLPRTRLAQARALQGATLVLDGQALMVGPLHERELLPWGTLYAYLVVVAAEVASGEAAFVRQVEEDLRALGVSCRIVCGRHQLLQAATLSGYSLMLDGLSGPDSLHVLEQGLGRHRSLGCGLFVPHKSAAAVGTPP
jgi:CRISPR-associated protein Cas6